MLYQKVKNSDNNREHSSHVDHMKSSDMVQPFLLLSHFHDLEFPNCPEHDH